ncbi:MAG: outer membrane lipoprotein carrier protein LolA [Desulfobacterales bacterium]|nr:outer membrane lipoprotein carrier protein LolA [Desulfobacterales bacterium]
MNKVRRYQAVAAAMVLLSARLCFGWADTWDGLKAATGTISSVSATFVQEKHMKVLIRPLISEGLLFYQTPDSLRWEYQRPIQSILIAHAGKTKKFIRRDGKIIADAAANAPAMQFVIEEISRWLKGRFDENPVFTASLAPGRRIVLTPIYKGIAEMIQRIELVLSERPGIMESVMIYENENSYTRLKFSNVELNRPLDPRLFEDVQ